MEKKMFDSGVEFRSYWETAPGSDERSAVLCSIERKRDAWKAEFLKDDCYNLTEKVEIGRIVKDITEALSVMRKFFYMEAREALVEIEKRGD